MDEDRTLNAALQMSKDHANTLGRLVDAQKRIQQLEEALRKLDDMILELDAGDLDLYEVGDFIDAALAGGKKDG